MKEQHNTKYTRDTRSLCSKEVGFDVCSKILVLNNINILCFEELKSELCIWLVVVLMSI